MSIPLISVIVPVYNTEKYLVNAINSICKQTYSNLQIIIINDGSTDNSAQICDLLAKEDPRILVIHQSNKGIAETRNVGVDATEGEYIAFVDSDDCIDECFIYTLYNNIIKYGADISMCNYDEIYDINIVQSINNIGSREYIVNTGIEMLNMFHGTYHIAMSVLCNKLYKKSLFQNIKFPKCKKHEDDAVIYKLIYNSRKIVFEDINLYHYLQKRTGSITNSISGIDYDIISIFEEQLSFYKENKLQIPMRNLARSCAYLLIRYYYSVSGKAEKNFLNEHFKNIYNEYIRNCRFPIYRRLNLFLFYRFRVIFSLLKKIRG